MKEIWKSIAGHSRYQVSNLGGVRSLDTSWIQQTGRGSTYEHHKKGRVLRPGVSSTGYIKANRDTMSRFMSRFPTVWRKCA